MKDASDCILNPGTFVGACQYQKNYQSRIYSNLIGGKPVRITYTKINDQYMEGFFSAILGCDSAATCDVDSIVVTGTFKGDNIR